MLQLQRESNAYTITKEYVDCGHRKPQTRREFLNAGLVSAGGALFAPTLMQLISQSAWGAEAVTCASSAGGVLPPAFINIQMNGGSANFANFLTRGNGGDPLTSYDLLGMGISPRPENLFANNAPFWINPADSPGASGFAQGLVRALPRTNDIHGKTVFVSVAAESVDDRRSNTQDFSAMLQAAGFIGSSLPYMLTGYGAFLSETKATPVNQFSSAILGAPNFLSVDSVSSISGSLSPKGAFATLTPTLRTDLVSAIESLSKLEVDALIANPKSNESQKIIRQLTHCATEKNRTLASAASEVDYSQPAFPTNDNADTTLQCRNIWSTTNITDNDGDGYNNAQLRSKGLNASLMKYVLNLSALTVTNCMRGYSGAALINLGGYDYHSAFYTRASAELKDKFVGDLVGRVLKTAKAFNRPVFIYVNADGSVSSQKSSSNSVDWSGDFPKRGMNFIIAYNPAGAPSVSGVTVGNYTDMSYQLNHFTNAGVVSNDNPIGSLDAQDLCAAAVFLNFLNFAGKGSLINTVPALANVKKRLTDALPSGTDIMSYYTRIK